MLSVYLKTNIKVEMPKFQGRLLYMQRINKHEIVLPSEFEDFTPTIAKILEEIHTHHPLYVTIDEKTICNETHRRAGKHVDFNWYDGVKSHQGDPGEPGHIRRPNKEEVWGGMILVSNYPGCRVFKGSFSGDIGKGGDCSDVDTSSLESEVMEPSKVYLMNSLCIHEPLVIGERVNRTLIRINFHPNHLLITNLIDKTLQDERKSIAC